ncbi:MAG: BolA family protein [Thiohalomonadaceae bacterium]
MEPIEVQNLIQQGLGGVTVQVTGDGSHFEAVVIGEMFAGMSPVKRQQAVYGPITGYITSGAIHALSIKAYTPDEWEKARKLKVS